MALQAYLPALRELGIRRPRNKYRNVAESYLSYCKKRKRRASRTRMLKRRMIKLLEKLLSQRDGIHSEYGALLRYTQDYQKRLSIIRKVLVQEKKCLKGGRSGTASSALTVIMYVPCQRQGNQVRRVRCKGQQYTDRRHIVHRTSSRSRLSMRGIRLKDCIRMQQKLMNVKGKMHGCRFIYANNANRKFCTNMGYPHPLCKGRRPGMNL